MGCFDSLYGDVRCPECGVVREMGIQTKDLGCRMSSYRVWDLVDDRTGPLSTESLTCEECQATFEITPHMVLGILCPFDEEPPNVYDPSKLIPWLERAARENHDRCQSRERALIGLMDMMDVHIRDLDGMEAWSSEFFRGRLVTQGFPWVEAGMSSEDVIRMVLKTARDLPFWNSKRWMLGE